MFHDSGIAIVGTVKMIKSRIEMPSIRETYVTAIAQGA